MSEVLRLTGGSTCSTERGSVGRWTQLLDLGAALHAFLHVLLEGFALVVRQRAQQVGADLLSISRVIAVHHANPPAA